MSTVIPTSGLYYDFIFPVPMHQLLTDLIAAQQHDPNTPQIVASTGVRQWFSQPRPGTDSTTEVLTIRYKLPLSVSEITLSALRVPAHFELWYQDRSNNWRQVLDGSRIPVALDLSGSDVVSWYTYHTAVYPIVVKAIAIRATRRRDDLLGVTPFVIGIKNVLVRRNVYDRSQGTQAFEDEQDALGNVIAKYIKDWDAPRAIDDNATTFWKCAPMPDPTAVANCFLDVRDPLTGGPQSISRLFVDPVYTGNDLNIYYSSDDTVGTRKLSPITLVPDVDVNTDWRVAQGRRDLSTGAGQGIYTWTLAVGPLIRQDAWFGIEWTPDFPADTGPAADPILLKVTPATPTTGVFTPAVVYDVGAGEVVLELTDGTTTTSYHAGLSSTWAQGEPLRIVVGYRYAAADEDPDTVSITVQNRAGDVIATTLDHPDLPANVSLDGAVGFDHFRGLMTAHVIKLENYAPKVDAFMANPAVYVNPDPVIPDANGVIPSTTLDNAVYAADWTAQEHGIGGSHDSHYSDKEWTPIWKNYVTERAMLVFPQSVTAKYLKLELSNLSPEPYPIYDAGVSVSYQSFPISVTQQSSQGMQTYSQPGGYLGLGDTISINGIRTINWLNPYSVQDAVQAIFGNTTNPVVIQTSPGIISDTIPANTGITSASQTYGVELGNTYIYRREALDPYILAQDQYNTTIKAEGLQQIAAYTDVPWQTIEASNPGAIQHRASPGALPILGTDWWVFPGQTLKLPAAVMTQLTSGETVTDFHWFNSTRRTRFTTTSVHRYETRTLTRDKAIAYFAGFREVQPYTTTYVTAQDADVFEFTDYGTWTGTNTVQIDTGPTSTLGSPYVIPNPGFVLGLGHWEPRSGVWDWSQHVGHSGGPVLGSAHVAMTGTEAMLISEAIPVTADTVITPSTWIRWDDVTATSGGIMALELIPVNGSTEGTKVALAGGLSSVDIVAKLVEMPSGRLDGYDFLQLIGTYTVPHTGVTAVKLVLRTNHVTGDGHFDDNDIEPADYGVGTLFRSFTTTSAFNMVQCDFRDTGLVRSNPMWADIDPLDDTNIPNDLLAPYVVPLPETIPRGFWADSFAQWADTEVAWGEPHAVISVNIDGTLVYQGRRTLHFIRDAGVGEAGVRVRQWTNFEPNVKARVGAVFRKTVANSNEVTVRLRRPSDGVVIYEETLLNTPVGYWYEYRSPFFDIPEGIDQVYNLELTLEGDEADDLYLSDLYTEIANIRYLVLLGELDDDNGYLDVTDLVYAGKETYVSHTEPVNDLAVQVKILSPKAWALGASLTPNFLRT